MIKVCCFYLSKPFRSKQFAKVYPEKIENVRENAVETFEPTIIRHISILNKKDFESQETNQHRKPSVFTFE